VLRTVAGVARDSAGNIYGADMDAGAVVRMGLDGVVRRFAGTGSIITKFVNERPADSNGLYSPYGIAFPSNSTSADLYIADSSSSMVHRVRSEDGMMVLIAGSDQIYDFRGDGGPASLALLNNPCAVAIDANNNVLIGDTYNFRIRTVWASNGTINTTVGTGAYGSGGDGGLAISANITYVWHMSFDSKQNLLLVDSDAHLIRRVSPSGIITTIIGNGQPGASGDGGPALQASLYYPQAVVADAHGNIYVADYDSLIRVVWASTGIIQTLAGCANGCSPGLGDGGPASLATLNYPYGLDIDRDGNLLIADTYNARVRKVWFNNNNTITTVLHTEEAASADDSTSDGRPATAVELSTPTDLFLLESGDILNSNEVGHQVLRMFISNRTVLPFFGTGVMPAVYNEGDGKPATVATVGYPRQIVKTSTGDFLIVDLAWNVIRRVNGTNGNTSTFVGNGVYAYAGDGGPATMASFKSLRQLAIDTADNVYIADAPNYCIRMVNATTGNITAFAGVCTVGGCSGDGGPASLANIGYPYGLAIDGKDNVYIIDSEHNVVRVVMAHNGTITRFIGTQSAGAYSGDGGPALLAEFSAITAVMFDEPRGAVYLMDSNNFRLRRVDLNTTIVTTVAGTGGSGNTGDNGPATSAEVGRVLGGAIDSFGNVMLADSEANRIRVVMTGTSMPCPQGYYCPCGQPVPCPSAEFFCVANLIEPLSVSPGYYSVSLSSNGSVAAATSGTNNGTKRTSQRGCTEGSFCVDGVRIPCFAGSYGIAPRQASSAACPSCPAGRYNALRGKTSIDTCLACPTGTLATSPGAAFCTTCPVGEYPTTTRLGSANASSFGPPVMTSCTACPFGTLALPGMATCVANDDVALTRTTAFSALQVLHNYDPTAKNALFSSNTQKMVSVPIFMLAILPLVIVIASTMPTKARNLPPGFVNFFRGIDLYAMRHALQEHQSPTYDALYLVERFPSWRLAPFYPLRRHWSSNMLPTIRSHSEVCYQLCFLHWKSLRFCLHLLAVMPQIARPSRRFLMRSLHPLAHSCK
jgi:sugar lactone lactonase YvrE